jgi:hypothetical protein
MQGEDASSTAEQTTAASIAIIVEFDATGEEICIYCFAHTSVVALPRLATTAATASSWRPSARHRTAAKTRTSSRRAATAAAAQPCLFEAGALHLGGATAEPLLAKFSTNRYYHRSDSLSVYHPVCPLLPRVDVLSVSTVSTLIAQLVAAAAFVP